MAKALTKREKIARAAEYARTVETVQVMHGDLEPGMISVRPSGARYLIVSVGQDKNGIFARQMGFWRLRPEQFNGADGMCYQTVRIDEFGLPDADLEREMEAKLGPTLNVCPPDAVHLALRIEKASIPA